MMRYLIAIIFFLVLDIPLVAFASAKEQGNRLRDIWLQLSRETATLVMSVQGPAQWELWPVDGQRVKLLLKGVSLGQKAEARIIEDNSGTLSASFQKGEDFLADLNFSKPIRRVDYSQTSQERHLLLKFYWPKPQQKTRKFTRKPVSLKRIRYGKQIDFDRVVMEFSGKPLWRLLRADTRHILIQIQRCKPEATWKPPKLRLLKKVAVKFSEPNTNIEVITTQATKNFRLFWLEAGNRMVMDVMSPQTHQLVVAKGLPKDFDQTALQGASKIHTTQAGSSAKVFKPLEIDLPEKDKSSTGPKVVKKILKPIASAPLHSTPPGERPYVKMSKAEALAYGRILGAQNFKEYEKGIRLIDEFLQKFPRSGLREKLLFMRGDLCLSIMKLGNSAKLYATINSFKRFIKEYPHSPLVPRAYLKMARASRLGSDYYGAMSYLNLLFERYHGQEILPAAYLERGIVFEKLQLADKAFEDFNAVVRRFPLSAESARARLGIAQYLHNKGLYQEAEKWLAEVEAKYPDFPRKNPVFFLVRGKNDLYLKRFTTARELFFKALNLGDSTEPVEMVLTRIGDTYLYQGKKKAAKRIYTFVVTHFPDSEAVSIALLRLAELNSGIEKFKKLHERYGDSPLGELALLKLANVYFKNKAYEKAIDSLREMVVEPAKDEAGKAARALFLQALEEAISQANQEKRYKDCISLYQKNKALISGELSPNAKLCLAEAFYKSGASKEALRILGPFDPTPLAPKMRPRYVMVYAKALESTGHTAEAIKILERERAKSISERWIAERSLFLAKAYHKMGQLSKALTEYKRAVSKDKVLDKTQRLRVWLKIGKIQNSMGKVIEARDAFNKCVTLAGKASKYKHFRLSALMEMAETYIREGSPSKAAKILKGILDEGYGPKEEHYWDVKFRLARCYEQMGMMDKAKPLYKEIGDEGPNLFQFRAQMRLGSIVLNDRLKELPHWSEVARR